VCVGVGKVDNVHILYVKHELEKHNITQKEAGKSYVNQLTW